MHFSLSKEASQKLRTEKSDRKLTNVFVKFAVKGGLVKQIRVCDRTQFYKLKRVVCCSVELDPDAVCFLFEGRELEPLHRTYDVNMRDGAVVVVLERSLLHPTIDSVLQDLVMQQAASKLLDAAEGAASGAGSGAAGAASGAAGAASGAAGAASGAALSRAKDPEAILAAVEHEGWVKATPKLQTLVRDFCGYGAPPQQDINEDLNADLGEDLGEDLPLSARKHAHKRRRLHESSHSARRPLP